MLLQADHADKQPAVWLIVSQTREINSFLVPVTTEAATMNLSRRVNNYL